MRVRLDLGERRVAEAVATAHFEYARRTGASHKAGGSSSLERDIAAKQAEMVVAKTFGFFWNVSLERRHDGDVCGGMHGSFPIEVRYTASPAGRLIVRPDDNLTRPYVLVNGGNATGEFELVGWLRGSELRDEWLTDFGNGRSTCWAVPVSELRRFE